MRTTVFLVPAALLSASALAAGIGQKHLPVAPTVTIEISVPYSFTNVHQSLDHAVISCVAQIAHLSSPIGSGQVTVPLKGQPASGVAVIKIQPAFGQRLSDAKYYACGIQVSDGKMTIVPQLGAGFDWARAQPGTTYMVNGKIE